MPARLISTGLLSLIIILVPILILGFLPAFPVFSSGPDSLPLLFTIAKRYEPLAWIHGADRFSPDATIFLQNAAGRHPLMPAFAASADPTVSFDGKTVLFAGKQQTQDHWQIWEVAWDGGVTGEAKRISSCADDCVRPFYLPDDRAVYAKKIDGRFVIEAADLEMGKLVQLTYGPGNSLPTDVLRDGRILFETTFPIGSNGKPELYTVYSDGSGVESYRCDHGKARYSGKQVAPGDIVFTSGSGLARFTSARAQEILIPAPTGEYAGEAAETSSGDWLLSWRPNAKSYYQVKRWKPGEASLATIAEEQNADVIQPTLILERIAPKRHPSGLHDWPNANLLCLNAYTSKYKFAARSIHAVRLYTQDRAGTAKLLGTAPVEPDGSFFVQIPTERPLQIELLDGSGKTLKRQAGWFWMRRGEQRACVGCHAGPETAPENAVPMVLLKSTTPSDLTSPSAQASSGGH
ncbi:MAG: hypothetical protein WCF68_05075 [Terriglobales bacterium]